MQWVGLADQLGIAKDDRDSIVRELLAEEIIKQKPASQAIFLTRKGILELQELELQVRVAPFGLQEQEPMTRTAESSEQATASHHPMVFISHSSKDADLALALIELLKAGLGLLPNQIRCSSVDGYRLPVGVNTEARLREEVNAAHVVIGLITPSSLSSAFVMFELGARWGANQFLAPLLAGVPPSGLSGPLSLLNALSANNEAQLHQLLEDIANNLGLRLQNAASYVRYVSGVKSASESIPSAKSANGAPAAAEQTLRDTNIGVGYSEELERRGTELIARLSPEGKLLIQHLVLNEPIEVGRQFKDEIARDIQDDQLAIAFQSGIVRHNEVRSGTGAIIRTEYVVNPQFKFVLQDLLFS